MNDYYNGYFLPNYSACYRIMIFNAFTIGYFNSQVNYTFALIRTIYCDIFRQVLSGLIGIKCDIR